MAAQNLNIAKSSSQPTDLQTTKLKGSHSVSFDINGDGYSDITITPSWWAHVNESHIKQINQEETKVNNEEIEIFIFDFDNTITEFPTDSGKYGCVAPDDKTTYEDSQVKSNIKVNVKHAQLLKAIFKRIQSKGKELAVASFHDGKDGQKETDPFIGGPKYIREYLSIGLPGFDFETLPIRAYLPTSDVDSTGKPIVDKSCPVLDLEGNNVNHKSFGKNPLIEFLVKDFNTRKGKVVVDITKREQRKRVMLIDDNITNIKLASEAGYSTIYVNLDANKSYDYILELLQKLNFDMRELLTIKKEILKENDYWKLYSQIKSDATNIEKEKKALLDKNLEELNYINKILELRAAEEVVAENGEMETDFKNTLVSMKLAELEDNLASIEIPYTRFYRARIDESTLASLNKPQNNEYGKDSRPQGPNIVFSMGSTSGGKFQAENSNGGSNKYVGWNFCGKQPDGTYKYSKPVGSRFRQDVYVSEQEHIEIEKELKARKSNSYS